MIKVKDLIEALSKLEPEKEVVYSSYGEMIIMRIDKVIDGEKYVEIEGD